MSQIVFMSVEAELSASVCVRNSTSCVWLWLDSWHYKTLDFKEVRGELGLDRYTGVPILIIFSIQYAEDWVKLWMLFVSTLTETNQQKHGHVRINCNKNAQIRSF